MVLRAEALRGPRMVQVVREEEAHPVGTVAKEMKKRVTQKRVAVFDVDGTIFRSSLLIELVEALAREKIFKPGVVKSYAKAKRDWLDRKGDYRTYIDGVVYVFEKNIKGVRYKDFLRVATRVVAAHKDRVYRFTRDLVRELKHKKYFVVAISHSPKGILDGFCKNLGFDKVYGLFYELDENEKFNGKTLHRDVMIDKAAAFRRVVAKENLTVRGSVGVGDTESDIAFLKLVDRPICFNPNAKLLAEAKKQGWEVVVERKDVIFRIQ